MSTTAQILPSADRYRPRFHFTPSSTWMNDPNGLIRHNGRWHLFFQNNPLGSTHDNLSWGHAVSDDLATWEELPVALEFAEDEMVFSGSIVHDAQNVSGLAPEGGAGPLVAFYTSAYGPQHPTHPGIQAQSIAYSTDDGLTWTRYPGNPVLDRGSQNFRDPKVSFHPETGTWYMLTVEAHDHSVLVHTTSDLLTWEHASTFVDPAIDGGIWECPDLLRVPVQDASGVHAGEAWVLILSTNPGGPAGGSGTYALVGDFDGRSFTALGAPEPLDLGPDCYAAVSFSGVTGEPLMIGWMNNWDYVMETPTAPWRSSMTLPRRIRLAAEAGDVPRLRQQCVMPPVPATRRIDVTAQRAQLATLPADEPFRLHGTLAVDSPLTLRLRFGEGSDAGELVIEVDDRGRVTMDRSAAHEREFAPRYSRTAPYQTAAGSERIDVDLLVDRSTAELLLDEGRAVMSMQIFPEPGPVTVLSEPAS
ncbi:glycoside hydrolase family 32 protein [Brachybacterium alimentarium]|uniref:glycoside hydrolase family 32 protein n=1 Tax=Brachybacterium alimentarium TaxID=47845 RepID=UPI003FD43198